VKASSLRVRVTAWYVGLLTVALLLFAGAVYLGLRRYLESSLERSLVGQAQSITANFLSQRETKGTTWMVSEIVESYAPESSGRFIRITQANGSVIYQSGDTRDDSIDVSQVPPAVFGRRKPFRRESIAGRHLVLYSLPYRAPSGADYMVETGASQATIEEVLRSLLIALSVGTPAILVAAAIGGYLLMTRPLRPVVLLTEQAERIGTRDVANRLPVIHTGDELERLSHSLNRMLCRLEDALDHNRRFSADVSHELRTPLTILRGELEALVRLPRLAPEIQDGVGSALEEIDRMSKIVGSLLAISRLDSGGEVMNRTVVDLAALTHFTVEQMRLLAVEKSIELTIAPGEPTLVLGDKARLSQVLVNLLDNAIKYTGIGGNVSVSTANVGNTVELRVRDNGIGIPASSLPFIFDRFYRADKARSRASGGAGLGLSIVKAVCNAHHATINVESCEGGGTTVSVILAHHIGPAHKPAQRARSPRRVAAHERPIGARNQPAAAQPEISLTNGSSARAPTPPIPRT
jgi:heavy metal sensor kinase